MSTTVVRSEPSLPRETFTAPGTKGKYVLSIASGVVKTGGPAGTEARARPPLPSVATSAPAASSAAVRVIRIESHKVHLLGSCCESRARFGACGEPSVNGGASVRRTDHRRERDAHDEPGD